MVSSIEGEPDEYEGGVTLMLEDYTEDYTEDDIEEDIEPGAQTGAQILNIQPSAPPIYLEDNINLEDININLFQQSSR